MNRINTAELNGLGLLPEHWKRVHQANYHMNNSLSMRGANLLLKRYISYCSGRAELISLLVFVGAALLMTK